MSNRPSSPVSMAPAQVAPLYPLPERPPVKPSADPPPPPQWSEVLAALKPYSLPVIPFYVRNHEPTLRESDLF